MWLLTFLAGLPGRGFPGFPGTKGEKGNTFAKYLLLPQLTADAQSAAEQGEQLQGRAWTWLIDSGLGTVTSTRSTGL